MTISVRNNRSLKKNNWGQIQPRSQGLSSLPPLSLTMEAEKRDPGNEVGANLQQKQ